MVIIIKEPEFLTTDVRSKKNLLPKFSPTQFRKIMVSLKGPNGLLLSVKNI